MTSAGTSSPLDSTRLCSRTSFTLSTLQVMRPAFANLKMPSLDCPA